MSGQEQDERSEDERAADRDDGDDDHEPPRLAQATLDPHQSPSSPPPAISRPSSSTVAVEASRSPTMRPSYITAIRSASTRISSRSSLTRRIPRPSEAAWRR